MIDEQALSNLEQVRQIAATIRRQPKDKNVWSDAFCTPQPLADRLGYFDTDPCSNPRSHIHAGWAFMLEKGMDGLKLPWRGRTFENWPYSLPDPWADKSIHEMRIGNVTELVVLAKLDPSTRWWSTIIEPVLGELDRWDFNDRIQFDEHPESIAWRLARREEMIAAGLPKNKIPPKKPSNNFPSVILHHRDARTPMLDLSDVATLWRKG